MITNNPHSLFLIMNNLALFGWVLLIAFPNWKGTRWVVLNGALSIFMSVVYLSIIVFMMPQTDGGFSSLEQVSKLFDNPYALLAGWVHYLAFDLFIGAWALQDSRQYQINHFVMVPVLLLTFILGPIGLLTYFILRRGIQFKRAQG